ncbi:hypothetical protein [Pantoea sp. Lu_F5_004]|uniref:hypothetical protein n=1 Tax=Pantoea sp. Lu_F5_004 TaxID=3443507 RepID=UPI003EBBFDF6
MGNNSLYKNSDLIVFNNEVISLAIRKDSDKNNSLVIRRGIYSAETVIYTSKREVLEDLQVAGKDSGISIVWRERNNQLFSESEFHYAKVTAEGIISEHRVLECSDNNFRHAALLRAKVSNTGHLLLSIVSGTMKKIVLIAYHLKDYSQVDTVSLDDAVTEKYFTSQKIANANVILLVMNDGSIYLQFILSSGTLRNYSVSINKASGKINASKLFDFALDNIGYHNCLIDEEEKLILITYSGTDLEGNSIYVAKQKLFTSKTISSEDFTKISQTNGDYFRPFVIKNDDNYLIAWEGDSIHYTIIDKNLDIVEAENTFSSVAPGYILLTGLEGVFASCQTENLPNREFGSSFLLSKLY